MQPNILIINYRKLTFIISIINKSKQHQQHLEIHQRASKAYQCSNRQNRHASSFSLSW